MNEVVKDFGSSFYGGKNQLRLEWPDLEPSDKNKVINFLLDNMLPEGEYD